jgi:pimeloyl-ACP methyl ester carboxylesterase
VTVPVGRPVELAAGTRTIAATHVPASFSHEDRDQTTQERRVVVCLHGFGTDRRSWDPVLDGLATVGDVLAVDRPGFGETSLGDGPDDRRAACSVDGEAAIIAELLEQTGPSVLVGHSAGALIAAAVALRAPPLVRALVLEAPAIAGDLGPPAAVRAFARTPPGRVLGEPLLRLGGPLALRAGLRRSYAVQAAADAAGARMAELMRRPGWATDYWDRTIHWAPHDVLARLSDLDLPVLVVAGGGDRLVRRDQVGAVVAAIDGAALQTIQGVNHVPHEERPAAFLAAVLSFLRSA